jgi:hypothetical protein
MIYQIRVFKELARLSHSHNVQGYTVTDGNSSDTTSQGGKMERNYKMKTLHQG